MARFIWYRAKVRCGIGSAEAEITVPAAEFTIWVSIAFKLLSAMGTDNFVVGFFLNLLPVAVPPCHAALIRAKQLFLSSRQRHNLLAAVFAGVSSYQVWVAADMGTDGMDRDTQLPGDF